MVDFSILTMNDVVSKIFQWKIYTLLNEHKYFNTFSFSNYRYKLFSNILKDAKKKYRHIYTHIYGV